MTYSKNVIQSFIKVNSMSSQVANYLSQIKLNLNEKVDLENLKWDLEIPKVNQHHERLKQDPRVSDIISGDDQDRKIEPRDKNQVKSPPIINNTYSMLEFT